MSSAPPKIAFQGTYGAFSHEACLARLPQAEPRPFATFAEVFAAVREGDCAAAFLPVENSTAGLVPEVQALLPESGLEIVATHDWPIRMQLLGFPGARLEQIRVISSHPMALKQCKRLLAELDVEARPAYDTAGAAEELARSGERTCAVVAARAAGELYGLEVLRSNVEDTADNTTRFLVLVTPGSPGRRFLSPSPAMD